MFLDKIFGDPNQRYLKKIRPLVEKINSLEKKCETLKESDFPLKTQELKERLKKGETLDDLLPEAFALVREAAKRTLKQRHFDVQLMGGIALHQGKIVQMLTGEGKTLTATLPLYLNALEGRGCHLVTVNDYLARRDTVWMGQIYHLLGLSVGCLNHEQSFLYDPNYKKPDEEKEKIRDELGGFKVVEDFLRPVSRKEAYLADITYGTNNEFGFDYLRDNLALDEKEIVQRELNFAIIDEVDFILIDEARTPLIISGPAEEKTERYREFAKIAKILEKEKDYEVDEKMKAISLTPLGQEKIIKILNFDPWQKGDIETLHLLDVSLRAKEFFLPERDYIVKNGEVIIVDEFTGRLMPGRRWSGGIHQAVEAKEGVFIRPQMRTLATITFQNYFRMYKKFAGMTGTAWSSREEFLKVYGKEVVVIPPNKPMIRKDLPDKVFKTKKIKREKLIEEIKRRYEKGQPVLVGTTSIEENERLSQLLKKEGIPHQVLNAKYHEKEGEIIAQAGKFKAVTVATHMAGRGVDILLGGNPPDPEEAKKVRALGGLFVLGTERYESRRIDDQLRGRSGRQGDPGETQFFISLEDDLLRIFGGERIKALMEKWNFPEDLPIENKLVSELIDSAQAKVEGLNFDIRKHLLEYDDVLQKQRIKIYQKRREILKDPKSFLKKILPQEILTQKEKESGNIFWEMAKITTLKILDFLWQEHLETMEALRESVKIRTYGQINPLVAYRTEGYKIFKDMEEHFEKMVKDTIPLLKIEVSKTPTKRISKKPGRNDPCPCGSGKKYKKCCWPKYG
jgi:preprotein translocase subunit SecA